MKIKIHNFDFTKLYFPQMLEKMVEHLRHESDDRAGIKAELKILHAHQWKMRRRIRDLDRAIGNRWREYRADCKHNMVMHPKLNLPMVLQMSMPMVAKYSTRISKLTKEANHNAAVITHLQKLLCFKGDDNDSD